MKMFNIVYRVSALLYVVITVISVFCMYLYCVKWVVLSVESLWCRWVLLFCMNWQHASPSLVSDENRYNSWFSSGD